MDKEAKYANIVYIVFTVVFTAALLVGAHYLPESFYA